MVCRLSPVAACSLSRLAIYSLMLVALPAALADAIGAALALLACITSMASVAKYYAPNPSPQHSTHGDMAALHTAGAVDAWLPWIHGCMR